MSQKVKKTDRKVVSGIKGKTKMQQKFISVCSGIEAASEAWQPLGWEPLFYSEIEKFPAAVLDYRHQDVPNLGDMTKFKEWNDYEADVLVGGTPCQSFSVAGLRKGLDDPRGNLMLTYLAIAGRYRPTWVVWENVPGVLSSNGGRDFGTFLWALGQLGYGWSYRVLDAQYFGVPQRRRRVFVVGCLGGWQCSAAVLFESESMCGNPPPSREKRKVVAGTIARGFEDSGVDVDQTANGNYAIAHRDVAHTIKAKGNDDHREDSSNYVVAGTLTATYGEQSGQDLMDMNGGLSISFSCKDNGRDAQENITPTLRSMNSVKSNQNCCGQLAVLTCGDRGLSVDQACGNMALPSGQGVRRLTPVECERLQGFGDNYTRIPWRGKPASDCPDGPRYKALGNSMAVPVMRWIGGRIEEVENIVRVDA